MWGNNWWHVLFLFWQAATCKPSTEAMVRIFLFPIRSRPKMTKMLIFTSRFPKLFSSIIANFNSSINGSGNIFFKLEEDSSTEKNMISDFWVGVLLVQECWILIRNTTLHYAQLLISPKLIVSLLSRCYLIASLLQNGFPIEFPLFLDSQHYGHDRPKKPKKNQSIGNLSIFKLKIF